jgi:hypothetical protein
MKEIIVKKEEEGGTVHFTFRFKALGQLLDEGVPDSAPGKELTGEAEEALAGYLDEYRVGRSASMVIELPEQELEGTSTSLIIDAIRHHFGFRQDDLNHDLKISRREGVYSLILMLVNIFILLLFAAYVTVNEIPLDSVIVVLIVGLIVILNWATIWDTYELFVFDYRNLVRKRKIFQKITTIPLTVRGY